jgi:NADP-reducing hydrogenase subunit HndC
MYEMVDNITKGKATMHDLEKLEDLCYHIKNSSLCGLGQSAPNPVLSTMKYFKDEYIAHVREKRCPSKVCKELLSFEIVADKCIGCTLCAKNCPANCITSELKKPHKIDKDICIKCGVCMEKCKFNAVIKK